MAHSLTPSAYLSTPYYMYIAIRNSVPFPGLITCLILFTLLPNMVGGSGGSGCSPPTELQPYKVYPSFTDGKDRRYIRLGYLTGSTKPFDQPYYSKPGQSISGAITLAVTEVNDNPDILPNHTLQFVIAETRGKEDESIRQIMSLMKEDISGYIGPQETCVHEARIAASLNLPMISYVSTTY